MLKTMTRNELYLIDREIVKWKTSNPAFYLLLTHPIQKFYRNANIHLTLTEAKFNAIKEMFVEKDEHGKFQTITKNDKPNWKYCYSAVDESGETLTGDEVEEAFEAECKKMFNQTIQFDW